MYCGSCGNKNSDGARFCGTCGGKLDASPSPVPGAGGAAASVAPAYSPAPQQQAPAYQAYQQPISPTYPPPQAPQAYQPPQAYQAAPAYQPAYEAPPVSPNYPPAQQQGYATPQGYPAPQQYQQPVAYIADTRPAIGGFPIAGLGARFTAALLDSFVVGILYYVVGLAVALRTGGNTANGFNLNGVSAIVTMGLVTGAFIAYYWLFEGIFGATIGKGMMGLSVRDDGGGKCSLSESLIRNAMRLIDGIGGYLVGFIVAKMSPLKQRLGDKTAGTVVVSVPASAGVRMTWALVWVVALVGGGYGFVKMAVGASSPLANIKGPFVVLKGVPSEKTGNLIVGNLAFLQSKGGPERPAGPYKPGDSIYLKYSIAGYALDAQGAPNVQISMTALDPTNISMMDPVTFTYADVTEKNTAIPGSAFVDLPAFAPAGEYKLQIRIHDQLSGSDFSFTPSFNVVAPDVAPANGLEIRDVELSASQSGPWNAVLAISAGQTVYMRCNIFGAQVQNNRLNTAMGLKVLGPDGSVLLDKPGYINITNNLKYHPVNFWIPINGNLSTPGGMPAGQYTEVFTLTDNYTGQSTTKQVAFQIQ